MGLSWSWFELNWVRDGLGLSWSGSQMVWVRDGLGPHFEGVPLKEILHTLVIVHVVTALLNMMNRSQYANKNL